MYNNSIMHELLFHYICLKHPIICKTKSFISQDRKKERY